MSKSLSVIVGTAMVAALALAAPSVASAASVKKINPGTTQGLNPQPLPPKWAATVTNPGTIRGLNPQPLPPRLLGTLNSR